MIIHVISLFTYLLISCKYSITTNNYNVCLVLVLQPPVRQDLIIHEDSRSHTTMHHSP